MALLLTRISPGRVLSKAIKRLVGAIGPETKPLESLTESLEELEVTVERIEQRLLVIDRDFAIIGRTGRVTCTAHLKK